MSVTTRQKTLRFRRQRFHSEQYADVLPKWHLAAKRYKPRELYTEVEAVCGYKAKGLTAMLVDWSLAQRPPKGQLCKRCHA